jgi:hypothetical protein
MPWRIPDLRIVTRCWPAILNLQSRFLPKPRVTRRAQCDWILTWRRPRSQWEFIFCLAD